MATISLYQSPQNHASMANRRVPLSNIPNAANSPVRAVAAAAAKRARSHSSQQREYGHHSIYLTDKTQISEQETENARSSAQQSSQPSDSHLFTRKTTIAHPSVFERRLLASREKPVQRQAIKEEKPSTETLENIRQWKKHYRKVFPSFVFYFESVPEETRLKLSKQTHLLGAREELFFSKEVTHVVTTRIVPRPHETQNEALASCSIKEESSGQPTTINPSLLLERSTDMEQHHDQHSINKSQFTFEVSTIKKSVETDTRRGYSDVLTRAKGMGMKIWQVEKLQRMLTTMFDSESGVQHGHNTRGNTTGGRSGNDDLSQLLRNERLHGPSDRDFTVAPRDLVLFKGPFIYIHDINEKTKPVLVREYPKVSRKEDGTWPQFRSVTEGKCPFVEEPPAKRNSKEIAREKEAQRLQKEKDAANRSKMAKAGMEPPPRATTGKRALAEMENGSSASIPFVGNAVEKSRKKLLSNRPADENASQDSQTSCGFRAAPSVRMCGGEPVASGMQQSNITSAIRSQIISSTAAAPGAKAGVSKEVHELKRKVLEKNSATTKTDLRSTSTTRTDRTTESTTHNYTSRRLVSVEECGTSAEDEDSEAAVSKLKATSKVARKIVHRDPKPGYCENCRDKFDDFETHTYSRRHRKFANAQENWAELDSLLENLVRPLREY